jgi:hypothetical protein
MSIFESIILAGSVSYRPRSVVVIQNPLEEDGQVGGFPNGRQVVPRERLERRRCR